jgi:hypothetical protein
MPGKYVCCPKTVQGPLFPVFGLDCSLRALMEGTRSGGIKVVDHHTAAETFAAQMARREYGSRARALGVRRDGVAGADGQIYVAWLEDAGRKCGEEIRFAVIKI